MPFRKGQSGNPGGRARERAIANAMRLAANEVDTATGLKKLRLACEKVVNAAVEGDLAAFNVMADRIDGKPAQDTTLTVNDERSFAELSDAELAAIIAEEEPREELN